MCSFYANLLSWAFVKAFYAYYTLTVFTHLKKNQGREKTKFLPKQRSIIVKTTQVSIWWDSSVGVLSVMVDGERLSVEH